MREIKFRGKIAISSGWAYGNYALVKENEQEYPVIYENGRPLIVKRHTVSQSTSLKDKSGNEIYEGDIYHMGDENITYTVVWHDTGLIGKQNGSNSYAGLSHWQDRIEIVGSIYENPELK